MGRPVSTTAYNPTTYQWDTVATASYGVAGEVTSLWTTWAGTETRTYNSLLQLTRQTVPGLMDNLSERSRMQYIYTAGQNNGRIAESIDGISGEDVQYTYDSLQRLVLAATTGSGGWGDAYTYDGFGNLTAKTVTKGSAPAMTAVYDPATNWPVGGNYDANGNAPLGTWSVENRLLSQTLDGVALTWGYDGSGQRIMRYQIVNEQPKWTFYLHDIAGRRVAQFGCTRDVNYPYNTVCAVEGTHVYFAGKPIAATDATGRLLGATDRQGSVRAAETNGTWATASYYPYGEEKQPLAPDGMEKFGTYVRDSSLSGQDYARQRYYSPNMGRFNSPDRGGANPKNPSSWNKYAYVGGDPVNFGDPAGRFARPIQCFDSGCFDPDERPDTDLGWWGCSYDWYSTVYSEACGATVDPYGEADQTGADTSGGGGPSYAGSGNVTAVKALAQNSTVDRTWAEIGVALTQESDCSEWFQAGLMSSGNQLMTTSLPIFIDILAKVSGAGAFVGGSANAMTNSPLTPGTVVVVNAGGAFFEPLQPGTALSPSNDFAAQLAAINGGSDEARVFILLHELAHVLGMIRADDAGSSSQAQANQRFNNDEIWRNCSGTISSFPNITNHGN
jgi:RHS repeat-associated protein